VSLYDPTAALVNCCCCKISELTDSLCIFFCCCCSPYGAKDPRTVTYDIVILHETPGNYLDDFRRNGESDDQALERLQIFTAKHDYVLGRFSELVGTNASAWQLATASMKYMNFVEEYGPNQDSDLIKVQGKRRKYQTFKLICSELCWCYLPIYFAFIWVIAVIVLVGYNTKTGKFSIVGVFFLVLLIICFIIYNVITYVFLCIDSRKDSATRERGAYRRDMIAGSEIVRTKLQLLQAKWKVIQTRDAIQTPSEDPPPPKPDKSNRSTTKPPLPDGPMPIFVPYDYPEEAMLPEYTYIRGKEPDENTQEKHVHECNQEQTDEVVQETPDFSL